MTLIAIVDDSQTFRVYTKQILEHAGYEVTEFASADLLFKKEKDMIKYDLIMIDMNMPGMNGLTALENLRLNPMTKKTPVIFVTGEPARNLVDTAIRYKVSDFLSKPVDPDTMLARIEIVLKKNSKN